MVLRETSLAKKKRNLQKKVSSPGACTITRKHQNKIGTDPRYRTKILQQQSAQYNDMCNFYDRVGGRCTAEWAVWTEADRAKLQTYQFRHRCIVYKKLPQPEFCHDRSRCVPKVWVTCTCSWATTGHLFWRPFTDNCIGGVAILCVGVQKLNYTYQMSV